MLFSKHCNSQHHYVAWWRTSGKVQNIALGILDLMLVRNNWTTWSDCLHLTPGNHCTTWSDWRHDLTVTTGLHDLTVYIWRLGTTALHDLTVYIWRLGTTGLHDLTVYIWRLGTTGLHDLTVYIWRFWTTGLHDLTVYIWLTTCIIINCNAPHFISNWQNKAIISHLSPVIVSNMHIYNNCCLTNKKSIWFVTLVVWVVSKQLRLHGRVGDSTTLVNSLSPQMSELVEDATS